jgi:hypothetical protein
MTPVIDRRCGKGSLERLKKEVADSWFKAPCRL